MLLRTMGLLSGVVEGCWDGGNEQMGRRRF